LSAHPRFGDCVDGDVDSWNAVQLMFVDCVNVWANAGGFRNPASEMDGVDDNESEIRLGLLASAMHGKPMSSVSGPRNARRISQNDLGLLCQPSVTTLLLLELPSLVHRAKMGEESAGRINAC
jgi:hypothetical protein